MGAQISPKSSTVLMSKPTVLFLVPTLNFGGTEKGAFLYARALKAAEAWRPLVISLGPSGTLQPILDEYGVENWALNSLFYYEAGRGVFLKEGLKILRKLRPIHADAWIGSSFYCNLAVGLLGPLAGAKQRIWWQKSADSTIPVGRIEKWARRGITHYAANGQASALHLHERINSKSEFGIAKMLNVLDNKDLIDFEAQGRLKNSEFRILLLANFYPEKLHSLLLEAIALLLVQAPECTIRVDVFGNEPGRQVHIMNRAKALAFDLGLSGRVFFHTTNAHKQDALSRAHVGVLPTLSEGYSNALMEYMAAGLPVLASNILANRDVLGSDYASAFFENTADSLAKALLEIINNQPLRKEMGRANRNRILRLHRFDPASLWPFSNQAIQTFDLKENSERT